MKIDGCHISINKGDTGVIRFIFSHKKHNVPVGTRNFRLIIKKHKEDSDSSAIMDVTKQGENADDTYICYSISSDITNNEAGNYFWGLRVSSTGFVSTLQEGIFTIDRGTFYGVN